jgi:hypothetical protein
MSEHTTELKNRLRYQDALPVQVLATNVADAYPWL